MLLIQATFSFTQNQLINNFQRTKRKLRIFSMLRYVTVCDVTTATTVNEYHKMSTTQNEHQKTSKYSNTGRNFPKYAKPPVI